MRWFRERHRRLATAGSLLVAALLLASCGSGSEQRGASDAGLDDLSCSEVDEELEDVRVVLSETFGGGPEGREANQTLADTIEARPDCFSQEEIEMAADLRDMLPASEAERAAVEEAEEACEGDAGGYTGQSAPDRSRHDTAEDVVGDPQEESLPPGDPEPATDGETWVAFDFHDDRDFTGRVMVERHDDGGWFLRRAIHCGGGDIIAE